MDRVKTICLTHELVKMNMYRSDTNKYCWEERKIYSYLLGFKESINFKYFTLNTREIA